MAFLFPLRPVAVLLERCGAEDPSPSLSLSPSPGRAGPVPSSWDGSRSTAGLVQGVLNGPRPPGVSEDAGAGFWTWLHWNESGLTPFLHQQGSDVYYLILLDYRVTFSSKFISLFNIL